MADPTARFILTAEDRTARALQSADRGLKQLQRSVRSTRQILSGFGVALTARAFAGWISGALKAADATGEHSESIKQAKAAFDSFKKASDELALSFAGALAPAVDLLAKAVVGLNAAFFGANPQPFEKQIRELERLIPGLEAQLASSQGMPKQWQENFSAEIDKLRAKLAQLKLDQEKALGVGIGGINTAAKQFDLGMRRLDDTFLKLNRPKIELDVLVPPDGLSDIVVDAKAISLDDLIKPFPSAEIAKMFAPIREEGESAARLLGMTFKDAFDGWILGTERSFKELLRRMAVQTATSALFQGLATFFSGGTSGFAKFASAFFGGSRASGGSARGGMVYKVHPGEAFFTPGMDGHVAGAGSGSNITITNHIDARGADASLASRLPEILAQNRRMTMAEIRELVRRRRL